MLAMMAAMAAPHRAELQPAREYGVFWNLSRRTGMRGMAEPMFDGSPAREELRNVTSFSAPASILLWKCHDGVAAKLCPKLTIKRTFRTASFDTDKSHEQKSRTSL